MDKFIANFSTAAPRWSAGLLLHTGTAGASSASGLSPQAAAGIRSGPDTEGHTPPEGVPALEMTLSADLQQLLGIQAEPESPEVRNRRHIGPSPSAAHASNALADGSDLLARRMTEARRWLSDPGMQDRLRERGLATDEVESQLQRQSAYVTRTLESAATEGGAVFPLVPTAHDLFSRAVLEADQAQRDLAAGRPAAAGNEVAIPTTTPARIDIPVQAVSDPHIDLVRRDAALRSLQTFREKYVLALPQIGWRRLQPLWHFVQGDIYFLKEDHAASAFPCAITLSGGTDGVPLSATYPQHAGERTSVRRPFVRDQPVVVARSPDSASVRISTDGHTWRNTPFYTDAVVEAAKLEVWRDIMTFGNIVYRRVLENSLWL